MISFVKKIVTELKLRMPPSKTWKYEKQTEPPTFGWAKIVNQDTLDNAVNERVEDCKSIINENSKYKNGRVTMVVLSCRRWWTLERLLDTATSYFSEIEKFENIEKILVDNDSGEDFINKVRDYNFFDSIVAHKENLGMVGALRDIFSKIDSEYILFFEDDFVVEGNRPFIQECIDIFDEYPEIGIIRLKNQNNWWKPFRVISPIRKTKKGTEFWTWLPSNNGEYNVWSAGSVMFRNVSYKTVGELDEAPHVKRVSKKLNHAYLYENLYGKKYNKKWLAAKIKGVTPFVQPNDNQQSPGWE